MIDALTMKKVQVDLKATMKFSIVIFELNVEILLP